MAKFSVTICMGVPDGTGDLPGKTYEAADPLNLPVVVMQYIGAMTPALIAAMETGTEMILQVRVNKPEIGEMKN